MKNFMKHFTKNENCLGHRDKIRLGHRDTKNAERLGHRDTRNGDDLGHRNTENAEKNVGMQ